MSIAFRHARPEDLPEILRLANKIFRPERQSMGEEFPHVFSRENVGNSAVALAGGRLVGHFGLVPFVVHVEGTNVPVACAGAVCTQEEFRGQGIAGRLMDLAVGRARENGAVLMVVSGYGPMYRRHEVWPLGTDWRLSVARESFPAGVGRAYRDEDQAGIVHLHERLAVRYRWGEDRFQAMLFRGRAASGHRMWVMDGVEGTPTAWVMTRGTEDDGMRLADRAGAPTDVAALCGQAMDTEGRTRLYLRLFWHETEGLKYFFPLAAQKERGRSWDPTLKLLDLRKLVKLFGSRLERLGVRATEKALSLKLPGGPMETTDSRQVHHLLFVDSEAWPKDVLFPRSLSRDLAPTLPLPFPDYGLAAT